MLDIKSSIKQDLNCGRRGSAITKIRNELTNKQKHLFDSKYFDCLSEKPWTIEKLESLINFGLNLLKQGE